LSELAVDDASTEVLVLVRVEVEVDVEELVLEVSR
jgi:hypothetical protein